MRGKVTGSGVTKLAWMNRGIGTRRRTVPARRRTGLGRATGEDLPAVAARRTGAVALAGVTFCAATVRVAAMGFAAGRALAANNCAEQASNRNPRAGFLVLFMPIGSGYQNFRLFGERVNT